MYHQGVVLEVMEHLWSCQIVKVFSQGVVFVLVIVVIKHFEIGPVDIDLYIDFAVFRVFGQYFVNNFS